MICQNGYWQETLVPSSQTLAGDDPVFFVAVKGHFLYRLHIKIVVTQNIVDTIYGMTFLEFIYKYKIEMGVECDKNKT